MNRYSTEYWRLPSERCFDELRAVEVRAGYDPLQPRSQDGKWKRTGISINSNHLPIKINKKDKEILTHEFNTKYHQFDHTQIIHARYYGDHLYIFDSLEYGSYNIWGKICIEENEEFIKYFVEAYGINDYGE